MKNLLVSVLELDLTAEERNNFKQVRKPSHWDKHFNRLSIDNLKILKVKFEKQYSRYSKLALCWGTEKLLNYVGHCEYALIRINQAIETKVSNHV